MDIRWNRRNVVWKRYHQWCTGKPKKYTEKSIELSYSLKLAFKQPLRQTEGFINSIFKMSGLNIKCPDYSTLSRRCAELNLKIQKKWSRQKKQ